ncbi:MAG: hypothetical protein KDC87_22335, partial [Planctomycetes bacterium]|nr:hypothetical protein [Planctomycetota bacterium]
WENMTVSGVIRGTVANWALNEVQSRLVDEARRRIRNRTGDDDTAYYEQTWGVDLLDPNEGIAAWHNPFAREAVGRFLQRRVYDPIRSMLFSTDDDGGR